MATSKLALVAVMAAAVLLGMASAATYNVGEPSGSWDLRTNYGTWVSSKRFHPGDQIVFKYSPQAHDVVEVSKADYDSCSNANPIATHNSGNDAIALASPGTRYFICGFPGHCTGGMKIQIDVVPSANSLAPAGAPSANSPVSPPPAPASAATKATGFGALAAVMIAAGLMAY
ncbi:hypothetical protein BDA96_02G146000 [Sorghum bicolor]|jgi:hypothetical protein|uniref:Phytocyanin domain-containing protein n=2 Tax=Sorghum bicolor TaxID=4558 RepID=A0A921RPM8_SORBI|nr:mavicyanin [Sorghum bicolor]EER96398.1 hypothetical protein SORBI_3002G140300 [Sorghum bicolor]KAG0542925.1 hypothetical protein BDA96_02G146000 [Sorghum bicolor]|eukprot:XP_002459877.1 mavicyanin [Sorghum bicolor]